MIFVTVGTQLPFDRLVAIVDEWAVRTGRTEILAQVGRSTYKPRGIAVREFIPPAECRTLLRHASLIVSHAGMGTILTALQFGTPLLVMPRRAALSEHRNDHQLATATHLSRLSLVRVAWSDSELWECLAGTCAAPPRRIGPDASPALIDGLRDFVNRARRTAPAATLRPLCPPCQTDAGMVQT